jgi:PhoH-like ATPase
MPYHVPHHYRDKLVTAKFVLLDTNVLVYDPNAMLRFGECTVLIPLEVIHEIDRFKRDMTDRGHTARRAVQILDELRGDGNLGEGVRLENGGLLRICANDVSDELHAAGLRRDDTGNRLLALAMHYTRQHPEHEVVVVSKSIALRLKADALGIPAEDYEYHESGNASIYTGCTELTVDPEVINEFRSLGTHTFENAKYLPNEMLLLRNAEDKEDTALGRVVGRKGNTLIPLEEVEDVVGIRPLNHEQACAFDVLLDDKIKLVTLMGKAGTGKTLLAVAAGLQKVVKDEHYSRLLISRPTLPMGRDIGFIPGDIDEKMRPWMQPIYDAVELIREQDRYRRKRQLPTDLLDSGDIGIEPLTYIRGRSIPHQFLIIDESQNLTPLEVKTIITRVGFNTKVVLTGDMEQIDNPYVDRLSNGFAYVIDKFANEPIAAHMTLRKGERSELAELAANVL